MERHPFDPISAVFGLLFVGIGLAFMSDGVQATDIDGRVAVAVTLLFVGSLIAGLLLKKPARAETLSPEPEPAENRPTRSPPRP